MSVEINATNFPDANFRAYVSTFDLDNDGYLSQAEIEKVTKFYPPQRDLGLMHTLQGIEYFTEITTLEIYPNVVVHNIDYAPITELDLSHNTKLKDLGIARLNITTLDLSQNTSLEHINIKELPISNLTLAPSAKLGWLEVRKCPNIQSLDLSGFSNLYRIDCPESLTTLDISQNRNLKILNVIGCTLLQSVNIINNAALGLIYSYGSGIRTWDFTRHPSYIAACSDTPAVETYDDGTRVWHFMGKNLGDVEGLDLDSWVQLYCDIGTTFVSYDETISITVHPKSISVIEGNTASFTVTASGIGLKYLWQVSIDNGETWVDIKQLSKAEYSFTAALSANGYRYRCKISNNYNSVISNEATLTVEEDTRQSIPIIETQPSSVSVAEGNTAAFAVAATGGSLSYQWQINQNGTWYSIAGATSASYSITASLALNNARYRCQVSNAAGSIYSSEATLTVTGGQSVSTPTVTSNPRSVTLEEGQLASFRVLATGGSLSYQWQVKRNNTWYAISDATSQVLSVRAASDTNGNQYRCQVSNAAGVAYSAVATLTVSESTPLTFYGYHSIIISGKNTYGEWQMYPTSRPHVAPPEVKTSYVDVPGADGGLDYTELLNGKPNYGYRKGSWEFLLIPQEKWPEVYRSLCNFLHGREHTIVLEDDPKWVYRGRLSVNEWRSAAHNSLITIDYILEPIATSTDDEGYDPDADDLDAAGRILRKPGNEDSAIVLWNGTETVVPINSLFEDGDNILY